MKSSKKAVQKPLKNQIGEIAKATYKNWRDDRTIRLGASLAYYGLFAMVPLVLVGIIIAASFFSRTEVIGFFTDNLGNVFGQQTDQVVLALSNIADKATYNSGIGVLGFATLFLSASLFFVALQDISNEIWHNPKRVGWKNASKRYLTAYGLVAVMALLFLGAMVIQSLFGLIEVLIPTGVVVLGSIKLLINTVFIWTLGIATLTILFSVLTYAKVSWKNAFVSATVTVAFIAIGTRALSYYFANWASVSVTGAAGAIVLTLLWIYYESQIFLAGIQLTKTLTLRDKNATPKKK